LARKARTHATSLVLLALHSLVIVTQTSSYRLECPQAADVVQPVDDIVQPVDMTRMTRWCVRAAGSGCVFWLVMLLVERGWSTLVSLRSMAILMERG
jgi:hypothetical protein